MPLRMLFVMPSKFPMQSHSWTLLSLTEAEKTLDHSSFEYDGSGIPKKVVAFFEFDHRIKKQNVTLSFSGSDYKAYLKKDPKGRVQIKWYSDFSDELKAFFPQLEQSGGKIRFRKKAKDSYEIQLLEDSSASIWEILESSPDEQDEDLDKDRSYTEKKQRSLHKRIDRNARLVKAVKKHKGYVCEVCKMSYEDKYGELGREYIEAHHLVPISNLEEGVEVSHDPIEDFAVLCANCHRMIHRMDDPSDVEGLKNHLL